MLYLILGVFVFSHAFSSLLFDTSVEQKYLYQQYVLLDNQCFTSLHRWVKDAQDLIQKLSEAYKSHKILNSVQIQHYVAQYNYLFKKKDSIYYL